MKLFVDTSSLFKKYVDEPGSEALERLLAKASEIVVSPTTWIEVNHIIQRRLRDRSLTAQTAGWLRAETKKDFSYFSIVTWNENLESKAVALICQHTLKTMDAIQLASGVLSDSDIFVTSDSLLHAAAKKTLGHTQFI